MYIKLGKKRHSISIKEVLALVLIPLFVCTLAVIVSNLKPNYKISATIISNQSAFTNINRDSLKGLNRTARRLIRADFRQKKKSSLMELQTKLTLLESWPLMEGFILEHNLKPKLFPKRWDSNNQQWKKRERGILSSLIKEAFGSAERIDAKVPTEPSTVKAVKRLSGKLKVRYHRKTGFIRVSLTWKDPEEGAELVNHFIRKANKFIAQREQKDIRMQIKKVEVLLVREELSAMQQVLLAELSNLQLSSLMVNPLVNSAFKVIDPAMAPVESNFIVPKRRLFKFFIISSIATLMGIYFSRRFCARRKVDRLQLTSHK